MVMRHLSEMKCESCTGGVVPLSVPEARAFLPQVPLWQLSEDATLLARNFVFNTFTEALAFIEWVGALAESEGHHPDLHLTQFRHVRIELYTHAVCGLSKNDFILAAKIDRRVELF
jgi:4a-hydroxytetrahydrobiopterin dehydratase